MYGFNIIKCMFLKCNLLLIVWFDDEENMGFLISLVELNIYFFYMESLH